VLTYTYGILLFINQVDKDPDVRLDALFVVGEEIPKKVTCNSIPFTALLK